MTTTVARHKQYHRLPRWVSKLQGYRVDAITIGRTIYWRGPVLMHLLAHELAHVRQFEELGFFGFIWRYWREYRAGRKAGLSKFAAYRAISLEVEARQANSKYELP